MLCLAHVNTVGGTFGGHDASEKRLNIQNIFVYIFGAMRMMVFSATLETLLQTIVMLKRRTTCQFLMMMCLLYVRMTITMVLTLKIVEHMTLTLNSSCVVSVVRLSSMIQRWGVCLTPSTIWQGLGHPHLWWAPYKCCCLISMQTPSTLAYYFSVVVDNDVGLSGFWQLASNDNFFLAVVLFLTVGHGGASGFRYASFRSELLTEENLVSLLFSLRYVIQVYSLCPSIEGSWFDYVAPYVTCKSGLDSEQQW